ncbi:Ig-like domain-containing protein [Caenorhabditis elegans]|uniref:Ig-like domain-containing protein n=1 Tax=Caenorhabditis elegans TaxID=6239 RepID=Q9U310_CAEEL|nr:Ig-like domain-containing protein [Caenorhabditis elegans]CAB60318.1 Ig-like domain-containing protein [Caenorhabditis elegans]|eukprot:NP_502903.1 Uncharacterized protein CELE_Y105C5B.14 [Caenorhabditis elegans]
MQEESYYNLTVGDTHDRLHNFQITVDTDYRNFVQLVNTMRSPNIAQQDRAFLQLQQLGLQHPDYIRKARVPETMRQFAEGAAGKRRIRSCHGTYLHWYDEGLKVDMKSGEAGTCENWIIEDWNEKVVFRAVDPRGKYLRACLGSNQLTLVYIPEPTELWSPFENGNGTWSFLSSNGTWLSAHEDGQVCTVKDRQACEEFLLESW